MFKPIRSASSALIFNPFGQDLLLKEIILGHLCPESLLPSIQAARESDRGGSSGLQSYDPSNRAATFNHRML